MATQSKATPTPAPAHSISKRTGRALGEAIDGHTDFAVGWQVARHPAAVEARAAVHERDKAAYLSEVLAEYSA